MPARLTSYERCFQANVLLPVDGFLSLKRAEQHGLHGDKMQPSLFNNGNGRLVLTIHVDDVFLIGAEFETAEFLKYLGRVGWKTEVYGPFKIGDTFVYLKRKVLVVENGFIVRPDDSHIAELVKLTGVKSKKTKKTPTTTEFNKLSNEDEELTGEDVKLYRSCVGKLLYLSPDRPDIQYVTQGLAGYMKSPTKRARQFVKHLVSYLHGTMFDGVLMSNTERGQTVLNVTDGDS